jgi:ActR/RegA family two-component response regulator
MQNPKILILGSGDQPRLRRALAESDFVPCTRASIRSALDMVRHERPAAVVVNGRRASEDPLEFVLNVRDVDEHVPVLVFGLRGWTDHDKRVLCKARATVAEAGTEASDVPRLVRQVLETRLAGDTANPE